MCIWLNEWIFPKTLRDNQEKCYRPHEAEWKESPEGSSGIRGTNKKVQIKAITHAQFKAILKFILTRLHFEFFKNLFSDTHREKLFYLI